MSAAISEQTEGESCRQAQDAPPSDSTFPQFAHLPLEIRRMIWRIAATQAPRTIEACLLYRSVRVLDRPLRKSGVMYAEWLGDSPPAILSATKESRCAGLEVFTALHFALHEHPITKLKSVYADLDRDVFCFQMDPQLSRVSYYPGPSFVRHMKALFRDARAPFRRLRFDIRKGGDAWYDWRDTAENYISDVLPFTLGELGQSALVKVFLKQAWYFSSNVEFIELVCEEDSDMLSTKAFLQDVLEELAEGYSLLVNIEFFQVRGISLYDDESEVVLPTASLYFPPETRQRMSELSQS